MEDQHHPNDNGNAEEGGDNVPIQQRHRAIKSLEDYVQRFGLPHANGGYGEVMHQLTSCVVCA